MEYIVKIKGQKVELTEEEAQALFDELEPKFKKPDWMIDPNTFRVQPYIPEPGCPCIPCGKPYISWTTGGFVTDSISNEVKP